MTAKRIHSLGEVTAVALEELDEDAKPDRRDRFKAKRSARAILMI